MNNKKIGFYTTRNFSYAAAMGGAVIELGQKVENAEDLKKITDDVKVIYM